MAIYDGVYFEGRKVPLDGNDFRACDFVDVTFTYDARQGFAIDADCTFAGKVRLDLEAHARMALVTLFGMLRHNIFGELTRQALEREIAKGADSFDDPT